jgi:poly(ribitol-phosphate) beta-N-acetylglucosaminyltransferase
MRDVSIIITPFSGYDTIKKSILSVLNNVFKAKIEVILVADGCNNELIDYVNDIADHHENIRIIKVENECADHSYLRNKGIGEAKGKYITFLDSGELHVDNLLNMVSYANMQKLDVLKGYIKVVKDDEIIKLNAVDYGSNNQLDIIQSLLSERILTMDIILKREFLNEFDINFKNTKYMENIFYADLFSFKPEIEYYNSFIYSHKNGNFIKNHYSIEKYQDNDLYEQINVWKTLESRLKKIGVDYFELRLFDAVMEIINSMIRFSEEPITEECFSVFSDFLNKNIDLLKDKKIYPERYESVYYSILANDYENFLNSSKKRLLVTGSDLKFIEPALEYLKDYNIKIDKWAGHEDHDEERSIQLLNWADIIFCEWLLGNSVWYSKRKASHQKLIIRAHKFELTRDFGNQVNYEHVDELIAVSYYYLELFSNTFNIPRKKMNLISNYIETDIYTGIKSEDFKHNLAMVGYTPNWKGLFKGLKLLQMLMVQDKEYKLYLFGKNYKDVDWIWNNPEQRLYFEECEKFIKDNHLEDSIIFKGWTERSNIFDNMGYVLSLSDIESFHLAPAEGLAASTLALLLNWDGVEYVYPEEIIFDNVDDIKDMIISTYHDDNKYNQLLNKTRGYIIDEFKIEKFLDELKQILSD